MASFDWGAILAKAEAFMASPEGQKRVDEQVDQMMYGKLVLRSGGKSPEQAAEAFIRVLQGEIANSVSPNVAAAISDFSHSAALKLGHSTYEIYVYSAHHSRPSLVPQKYGGIDDLLALYNNGVGHNMNQVFGFWHGEWVGSRTVIPGAHFIESAIALFMAQYSDTYNVISVDLISL